MGALLAMVLVLALSGCVPVESMHPFWSQDKLVQEPAIVGTWIAEEKPGATNLVLRFEESGAGYLVSFYSTRPDKSWKFAKDWAVQFDGRLVRLGGSLFLDLYPKAVAFKDKPAIEEEVFIFFRPVHTLYRIRLEGDALAVDFLDDDWLKEKVKEKQLAVKQEEVSHGYLLTASTEELQELVAQLVPEMQPIDELPFRRQK